MLLREKWVLLMQRVPDIRIQLIGNHPQIPADEDDFLIDSILDEHLGKLSADTSRNKNYSKSF